MRGIAVLLVLAAACRPSVAIDADGPIRFFAYLGPDGRGSPIYSSERTVSLPDQELNGTLVFGWAVADFGPGLPSPEVRGAAPIEVAVDPCAGVLPPARLAKKLSADGEAFDFPLSSVPTLSVAWWPRRCELDAGVVDAGPEDRGGVDGASEDAGTAPDADLREVGVATVQGMAQGLAVAESGLVAVALLDAAEVRLGQWPLLDFARRLPMRPQPDDLALSTDGARLAVSHVMGRAIAVVTLSSEATQFVRVSDHPNRVIFGRDGLIYVVGEGPHLRRIDPELATITATIPVSLDGRGLALDPLGDSLFISSGGGGVLEVDLGTLQVQRNLAIPGRLTDLVIGADRKMWVANGLGPIACWDLVDQQSCEVVAAADGAFGLALAPDGSALWATFRDLGEVAAFDPITHSELRRIFVGGAPHRARFSPDGQEVLISNEDGRIHRVPR